MYHKKKLEEQKVTIIKGKMWVSSPCHWRWWLKKLPLSRYQCFGKSVLDVAFKQALSGYR